ncbi:hypothetical protein PIB30_064742, partial [Stylosanthes scabra]|nr:hypothetical protein [Stylosanthes scabra]
MASPNNHHGMTTSVKSGVGFPPCSAGEPAASSLSSNFVSPLRRTIDGDSDEITKVMTTLMMVKLGDNMAVETFSPFVSYPPMALPLSLQTPSLCFPLSFFPTAMATLSPAGAVIFSSSTLCS